MRRRPPAVVTGAFTGIVPRSPNREDVFMPWSNQGGGPWGSGPKGPWGSGPQNSGGPTPPDLEDLLRRSQDRLKNALPSGGSIGGKGFIVIALIALVGWGLSGFYTVQPNQQGVVLQFGKFVGSTGPGLNYHLPWPIQTVLTPNVTAINRIEVGLRSVEDPRRGSVARDVPEESLMLTGDENIVDVDFVVQWQIARAEDFLFNIQNPEGTIKAVAESAMREIIGRRAIQPILTGERLNIEIAVQDLMQKTLDEYRAGVRVRQVQMQKVDPPAQVIDAFRDVQAARADAERVQNEAQTYANRVVPEARGRAAQIQQAAEAYREQTVADAKGQASRFTQIYEEYRKAPEVTRQRIYLETMERVLGGTDKIIIDQPSGEGGQGVVPYLPLNELVRPQQPAQQPTPR
jgi:membrane protease subunit HflK